MLFSLHAARALSCLIQCARAQIFRESAGHKAKGILPQTINPVRTLSRCCGRYYYSRSLQEEETVPGIEHPGSTGVIYCSDRAMANGFNYTSSHEWANLGQGAPEVGDIPDAPPRPQNIQLPLDSLEYAPTTGVKGAHRAALLSGKRVSSDIAFGQSCARPSRTCTTTPTARA